MTNAGKIHYAPRRPTESNCTNSSFVIHSTPRRPGVACMPRPFCSSRAELRQVSPGHVGIRGWVSTSLLSLFFRAVFSFLFSLCMPLRQSVSPSGCLSVHPKYHGHEHTLLCQELSFMLLQSLSPRVTLGRLLCTSVSPHENWDNDALSWGRNTYQKNYERTFKGVCTKEHEVNVSYYCFVLFLFLINSSNNTMKKKIDMWTTLPC